MSALVASSSLVEVLSSSRWEMVDEQEVEWRRACWHRDCLCRAPGWWARYQRAREGDEFVIGELSWCELAAGVLAWSEFAVGELAWCELAASEFAWVLVHCCCRSQ